ncbi:anaerobic C4-dicarboxylate transporter [Sulfurimonas sp.]|uniref:anaerobic C4-dicarboxylate transporter n=1 Tax=Sulfurimonas sp. TaxID=2022749 RepID=UPI0025F8C24F|nr:anaerobic C4-dicarboxylate transporter [Sulfurimonas sp.]
MEFYLQLFVILGVLFYAARKGGIALGLFGGLGVVILVFGFGLAPGNPPIKVMLVMLSVIVAGSTLQASGGLDCMLQVAEKLLRKHPKYITILAPLSTTTLTFLCGTGHVVYTMLPIIYDISIKTGIRPERPLAASTVAAQMGIIISPVSVAVVSLIAMLSGHIMLNGQEVDLIGLLSITIPGTLTGVLVMGIWSMYRGKDLKDDADFQELVKDPEMKKYVYGEGKTLQGVKLPTKQWASMWIFLGAIAVVAILGAIPELRPLINNKPLSMVLVIQMFMLLAGAIIYIVGGVKAKEVSNNEVFKSGMVALVAVFGVAWMTKTMFGAHLGEIKETLGAVLEVYPWAYAIIFVLVSKLINSQGATLAAMVPIALTIGVEPGLVVAFAASCYGYFILPTYPSDLAAINFDRSGTTMIGRFVINHSFIIPGIIGVGTSLTVSYVVAKLVGII